MVKEALQKEIKEKVKEGVKPSDIKKLKRSKSADDIPQNPTAIPLTKSHSNPPLNNPKYPYTTLISQQQELERLEKETTAKSDTISLLRKKIASLEKANPPNQLLSDQLKEKQTQIENLRKQLETKPSLTELDQSLFARHKNLKDWFTKYKEKKALDSELAENIDEASTELLKQDQTISDLRTENKNLKLTNQSLQKDLSLSQRLAESRKVPFPTPENTFWPTFFSGLALGLFINLLNNSWKQHFKE